MPSKPPSQDKPEDRQTGAPEKPASGAKGTDREARLAEALRANLRRRKQNASQTDEKDA